MVTVMLGLTVTMNNALYESSQQANAAATVATVGEIMSTDLNQAQTSAGGFYTSTSNQMVFYADTSMGAGQIAKISYSATQDGSSGLYSLYRQVGSSSANKVCISQNIVSFSFQYFDVNGATTTTPANVDAIRVKLVAQVSGVTQSSSTTLNDFKVYPPNLN